MPDRPDMSDMTVRPLMPDEPNRLRMPDRLYSGPAGHCADTA